jgi:signal transduction histidine kinase
MDGHKDGLRHRLWKAVGVTSARGICVYYTLQYPPIGLALPIAAALFSAAEAGRLRISVIVSVILVGLAVYFAIRHANATSAVVRIDRGPNALSVTVNDDGQGLGEFTALNGIRGMSERAVEWGGQLSVTSPASGAGTVVTAVLPWPRSAQVGSNT